MKDYLVYVELNGIWTNMLVKATNWEEAEQLAELEVRKVSNAAEKAFDFREGYIKNKVKGGRCYIENGWEFIRE